MQSLPQRLLPTYFLNIIIHPQMKIVEIIKLSPSTASTPSYVSLSRFSGYLWLEYPSKIAKISPHTLALPFVSCSFISTYCWLFLGVSLPSHPSLIPQQKKLFSLAEFHYSKPHRSENQTTQYHHTTLSLSFLWQNAAPSIHPKPWRFPCQEKKCPEMDNSPFSINYIQRRNQMSAQYSEASLDHIPTIFDQFLSELPATTSILPSMFSDGRFKKEIQVYSEREAREVLMRLIEKSKASAQRKNWKVDETNYLLFVIDRYCQGHRLRCEQLGLLDWIDISKLIPNRDSSACQFRYLSLFPKSISNVPWSTYERQLLLRIIQNQNSNCLNWKLISQRLYEESQEKTYRTGKQCREHYTCFLKPNLKKGAWTDQQDYSLISLFLKLGKKWSKMTKFIQGRNQNSIKNRFFLMFENKKDVRLTNSDLVKMARRRKEKLQKKISVTQELKYNQEDAIVMSPTNTDSSNFQFQPQDEVAEEPAKTRTESQIFFAEQPVEVPAAKIEDMGLFMSEEFEKYIDL